jgi:hypothetical protein
MKFSTGDRHIISFSSSEIRKNQYNENLTLLRGVNKMLPYILHFSSDLYKIRYPIIYCVIVSFVKIVEVKDILYLGP